VLPIVQVRRDKTWFQPQGDGWVKWKADEWVPSSCGLPPPRFPISRRGRGGGAGAFIGTAFGIYVIGVAAVLAVLFVTISFSHDPSVIGAVLAPVTGVIGAFTGHAAGHSAARHD
jgi:hypothetical protein